MQPTGVPPVEDTGTILLYAPVPLHEGPEGFLLEDQACNGLRLWAENFARVVVMHPLDPGPPPPAWVPVSRIGSTSKLPSEVR